MKKIFNLIMVLAIASFAFVSCTDDDTFNALPELAVNTGLVLDNGASKLITAAELSVTDIDTEAGKITYTIDRGAKFGKLVSIVDETTAISTFTQQELTDSKIKYIHDGSQTLSDDFTFSVTDGENKLNGIFNISIGEKQISFFYVLNEGSANGSVSMIDKNGVVTNNYFATANGGVSLGQYAQSMAVNDTHAFIVVTTASGAGYVEVVKKADFKHVKAITGLSYPREIALTDTKAYVSNGKGADGNYAKLNNEIYVIDLASMEVTKKIDVGAGPEKMVVSEGKLYVANSGGWSNDDNTVSVIDLATDVVIETITVKDCPKDMVVDANGDIWVYCAGKPSWSANPSKAAISKISLATNTVSSFELATVSSSGIKNITISKNRQTVYFMSDAVYAMSITATALPTTKFIDNTFYGIDVNPVSDNLWLCELVDYTSPGKVHVYSNTAEKIKDHTVGVMPNSTTFSY